MKLGPVEKLTSFKHLNLFSIQYTDRDARLKNWMVASRSDLTASRESGLRPDAVVVVPFHVTEKKLVIIKEFRVALGGYQYGFPAGLVDRGETVLQAGKRELFEETGLTLTRQLRCSPAIYSSSGLTDESVSLLYAECDGTPTCRFNEPSEDIIVMMLSTTDAADLLAEKGLKFDVKSWIILSTFADHGIIC